MTAPDTSEWTFIPERRPTLHEVMAAMADEWLSAPEPWSTAYRSCSAYCPACMSGDCNGPIIERRVMSQ